MKITKNKKFSLSDVLFYSNVIYGNNEIGLKLDTPKFCYYIKFNNLVFENSFRFKFKDNITELKSVYYDKLIKIEYVNGYGKLNNKEFPVKIKNISEVAFIEVTKKKNKTWSYFRKEANKNMRLLEKQVNQVYKKIDVSSVSKKKSKYESQLNLSFGDVSLNFTLNKKNVLNIIYSDLRGSEQVNINKNNQEIRDFQNKLKSINANNYLIDLVEYARQLFF